MKTIRELTEEKETLILSQYAQKSSLSKGRLYREEQCSIRTDYQRDRDRILHSKAFRRLKHKTQVFLSPEGDHYRTRLTHTLEVAQIARTISRALSLNEDLTEAIALGHDLGHTPFGHCGEDALDKIHGEGFNHRHQSLRVVEFIERYKKDFVGLNLTEEVRDGILNHSGDIKPKTLEGQVVNFCDRIAYLNHDIDDAVRAKVLSHEDIPKAITRCIGSSHSERIDRLIKDVIACSRDRDSVQMSQEIRASFLELRTFMFKNVYHNPHAKSQEKKAAHIISELYAYYMKHPEKMPVERYDDYIKGHESNAVKDYIAGMSDRYAVNLYKTLFIPEFWHIE